MRNVFDILSYCIWYTFVYMVLACIGETCDLLVNQSINQSCYATFGCMRCHTQTHNKFSLFLESKHKPLKQKKYFFSILFFRFFSFLSVQMTTPKFFYDVTLLLFYHTYFTDSRMSFTYSVYEIRLDSCFYPYILWHICDVNFLESLSTFYIVRNIYILYYIWFS